LVQDDDEEGDVDIVNQAVDPFVDIDAQAINDGGRMILDYASDSSSDAEEMKLGNTWLGHDVDNSDNESVDSQSDDVLK
jgi:KAT8 regulatory NSL complex subunit 2